MENNEDDVNDSRNDELCLPSTSGENDDHRINCTNAQSLREIMDITFELFSNATNSATSSNSVPEMLSLFSESFKTSLQENIVINGLPFEPDKHNSQVTEAYLLSELSDTASLVACKRKKSPKDLCRILEIDLKHDFQNLKKAKLINEPVSSSSSAVESSSLSPIKTNKDKNANFLKFCKDLDSVKKTVEHQMKQKEIVEKTISLASKVKKSYHKIE